MRYCRPEDSITVIPHFLYITYIQNPGAAFGFLADLSAWVRIPLFIAITLAAGIVVYSYQRFIPLKETLIRMALGLIWGGAVGNFIDRIFYRKVVDFIDARYYQYHWYIFNLADSSITIGLTLLILLSWFKKRDSYKRF
jgi:signal peptidase II